MQTRCDGRRFPALTATVSALLVSACASSGSIDDDVVLKGNQLFVRPSTAGPLSYHTAAEYRLFRLSEADHRGGGRLGLARLPPTSRLSSLFGGDSADANLTVEATPVATGRFVDGVVRFELPAYGSFGGSCFVVVNRGSYAVPRPGFVRDNDDVALSLTPYQRLLDLASERDAAGRSLRALEGDLISITREIGSAEAGLATNKAFSRGQCSRPAMAPLPPRPANAYPRPEAEVVAQREVIAHLGSKLGCDIVQTVTRQACTPHPLGLLTASQLGNILSWADRILLQCMRFPPYRQNCLLGLAGSILLQYNHLVDELSRQLYQPYETWQTERLRIEREPGEQMSACENMLKVVNNKEQIISAAQRKIEEQQKIFAGADQRLNTQAGMTVSGGDLGCRAPLETFFHGHGRLRYVGSDVQYAHHPSD